ncbi:MAG: T9SS type A sorting domain-containing protein [Armatimonadetes bacterium]|nr:T9SS type A sorting domain-containing protein [Armatimonadota bacterium]
MKNKIDGLKVYFGLMFILLIIIIQPVSAIVKCEPVDAVREDEDCTLEIANANHIGGLYSFDVYITRNASWTENTALGNLWGVLSSALVFDISSNTFSNPQSSNYGSPITGAYATIFTNKVQFELTTSGMTVPTNTILLLTVTLTIDEPANTAGLNWNSSDTILYNNNNGWLTLELLGSDNQILPVSEPQLFDYTKLKNNYPNPFNPVTTISFGVKENETAQLSIFNIKGQIIGTKTFEAGEHNFNWDASGFASGIYFYKLETENFSKVRKMLLIK